MALSMGSSFSLAITYNGDIYSFGDNTFGQLGIGSTVSQRQPRLLSCETVFDGHDVVMVSAGNDHSSCVTSDGSVWLWGFNLEPALGLGDLVNRLAPVRIQPVYFNNSPVLMVACGCAFTMVLTTSGRVWTCGSGHLGMLGHGDQDDRNTLTEIAPGRFGNLEIGMIAVGAEHSLAITRETGILFTWGSNGGGELGLGYYSNFVTVPSSISPADFDGAGIASMSATWEYSMIVTMEGVLWACGKSIPGTGAADTRSTKMLRIGGSEVFGEGGVRMITCSRKFAMIVGCDGAVWCTQRLEFRRPVVSNQAVPDNTLRPWMLPRSLFNNEDIIVASASTTHCSVVTRSGRLYTWGATVEEENIIALGYNVPLYGINVPPYGNWWPRAIKKSVFRKVAIGRWHAMTQERAEAFVMGRHSEFAAVGGETAYSDEKFKDEVLRNMMQDLFQFRVSKAASTGMKNLLGHAPS